MTKKDFIKLIQTHREIFNCVALINATVRYDYPFMSVAIGWKTNNHRTIVKTFKGKQFYFRKMVLALEKQSNI